MTRQTMNDATGVVVIDLVWITMLASGARNHKHPTQPDHEHAPNRQPKRKKPSIIQSHHFIISTRTTTNLLHNRT